ncbi:transposase [Sandaracinus amylolyticus]|uniref:transposase n=1 Tax=Sandaracinus amylolyticus TaxID=927083 RepID=UPI001F1F2238|nr:transposase [Sandaracinus amylolyticus]
MLGDACVTQPRLIEPGGVYLITRRTLRRYHLFAPDPRMNRIFLYTLAIAATRVGVLVHTAVLMSTHEHLVVSDPEGRLPEFLHYLHRHMALATKVLRKWDGAVWDHEATSVVELRTPAAVAEKIAYAIANPVAAALVRRARDWPGVTTRSHDIGSAEWRIERPAEYFAPDDDRWPPTVMLRLEMPRAAGELGMSDAEFRELIAHEVAALESAARAEVSERGGTFLGADRCARLSPFRRARSHEPLRSLAPAFAVGRGDRDALIAAAVRLRAFRLAYRHAFDSWRRGRRDVAFPAGTWLMRQTHGAPVEPMRAAA